MPASARPTISYLEAPPGTVDLAIVGGGIVGACTAWLASQAGLSVVVVEKRPALALLTTPVSTGAFRLQFDNPEEIALVREGVELFDAFAERTGLAGWDIDVRHQGYLFCALTEAAADRARRLVERQRGWGLDDIEVMDGDEARRRWPYLSADVIQARYRAGDGWLKPRLLALGYAAAASRRGAAFSLATEVTGFLRQGERVTGLRTTRGDVSASTVMLAVGPYLRPVAAMAGLDLDIRPTRRQRLIIPELPAIPADAPMVIEEETAAHWRPCYHGCIALFTEAGTPPSEPVDDVPVSRDWAVALLDPRSDHALSRVTPLFREVWARGDLDWAMMAGQYEMTADRRPLLGPSPIPGLWVNGGYSGHGVMTSPGGTRIVVEQLTGRPGSDGHPFAVDRQMVEREHDVL
ncbi:MAG TPA: FAD-dependent oxidoreductase [Candidatus Limnocylindrales bacterium]|nr:FAD-dependent oxidoreductase [Candidatus Limnocylindrales bacterium]